MVATPNGEKTLAQIQSELQQAGYNGPWTNNDMVAAYLRTAGGAVAPQNAAPQVFGATPQVAGQGGDLASLAAAFNSSGALSQQQINNQKAQFDANLQFQREQMEKIGLPQLVIQQRLADLQQQQFQYQMYLTQQQQRLAEGQLGLQQSGLGLQALQAQAQLGGPSNWVQAYNLAQGLRQSDIPVFEQRLLTGQQTPSAVGGAGLSTPQSMATLAQQAGVGGLGGAPGVPGGAGVPGVTINGQPVAGGGLTSIGGQISPTLAPLPFLSPGAGGIGGAGGFGGVAGGGTPGNYGSSSAPVFNAPGPNSPNDTAQGTLMPGTSSMFTGAAQNFGIGPGQGSNTIRGTRGTNFVGWTPQGLSADVQFLEPKSKVVANLWDETTNQNVADNSAVVGAIKGNGSGWGGAYYVPMPTGGGRITFGGISPGQLNPSHQYSIRLALPDEGGGVGSIMESAVPGSQIAGLPRFDAQGQPQTGPQLPEGVAGFVVNGGRIYSADPQGHFLDDSGIATTLPEGTRGASIDQLRTPTAGVAGAAATPAAPAAPAASTTAPTAGQPTGPDMSGVYGLGRALFAAGGGALGPQALEGLGKTGTDMLQSVGQAVGGDWNSFLDSYLKSRIGQGAAQAA